MKWRGFVSLVSILILLVQPTAADETCMSPYMARIVGQEDYVYIWTLGLEGVGDGEDKLVTVDVNQRYPLENAAQAHIDLEGRKTTGSTILQP